MDEGVLHTNALFTIESCMHVYKVIKLCWYHDGRLHREGDRPAMINYRGNGTIQSQRWYRDGLYHREGDLPAEIYYSESGAIEDVLVP